MKKVTVKALSLISVAALATVSISSVAAAKPEEKQTSKLEQAVGNINSTEKIGLISGSTFSASCVDMKNVQDEFEYDGYTKSDLRDISGMQNMSLPRSINSDKAKEYIYDRMLNTMDFYQSLEGSYISTTSTIRRA